MIKIIFLLLTLFVNSSIYGISCIDLLNNDLNNIDVNVVLNGKEYIATIIIGPDAYTKTQDPDSFLLPDFSMLEIGTFTFTAKSCFVKNGKYFIDIIDSKNQKMQINFDNFNPATLTPIQELTQEDFEKMKLQLPMEDYDDKELDTSKPTNQKAKDTQHYKQPIPNQFTHLTNHYYNAILNNSTVLIKNQFMQTCDAYIVTERVLLVHPDCKIIEYDLGLKLQNRGTHEIYTIKSIYHSNPLWKLGLTYIVTNELIDKNKIIGISCVSCLYGILDANRKNIEFFHINKHYYIGYLYVPDNQKVVKTRDIAQWLLQDIIDATPIDTDTLSINFTDIYPFSDTIATQILTSKKPSCYSDEKCGSQLTNLLHHVKNQKIQINGNYTLLVCKSKLDRPNKCFEINKAQYSSHCLWLYKSETTHDIKVIDPILDRPMSYDAYLNIIAAPGHLESIKSEAVAIIGSPSLNCLKYLTIDEFM